MKCINVRIMTPHHLNLCDIPIFFLSPSLYSFPSFHDVSSLPTQHRQSQELDVEVASMMEMAKTASVGTPSSLHHSQNMLHIVEVHPSSGESSPHSGGSPALGSRELLVGVIPDTPKPMSGITP